MEEIFRQVSFPWHCYIAHAHTHTWLYKVVYYRKKSILTMECLHYKSFNNLCGVADWLIISGLNAILSCASSFIKYNIYMYDMWFYGWWTWWTFMVNEIWYLLTKKRNSLILSWHTLIYFMQKLEQFRQCPWQKFFPHITLIRSEAPRGSVLPWSLKIMHLSPEIPERKYLSSLKIFFLCSPNP